ncbi:anti-sigma B factor antagonist [Alkalibaculum bacchi]|uniref:Anti-sigma factor antagonist n=1 Tax=Alkalibaculum bacchi TaxID=645887 RepID=A0A366HZ03_9FIRM|nr:STAS domain-containing protein [Alkalibaculum bacchi]RBP58610.1 anti-sigma B factor antagonist [Alkalibaculum bacchi]
MLSITTKIEQDYYQIKLNGEVDIYTVDRLKDAIDDKMKQNPKNIVFDFGDLGYIDSTGIGALIGIKGKYKDTDIKIINLRSNIKRLFEITGIIKIFSVE